MKRQINIIMIIFLLLGLGKLNAQSEELYAVLVGMKNYEYPIDVIINGQMTANMLKQRLKIFQNWNDNNINLLYDPIKSQIQNAVQAMPKNSNTNNLFYYVGHGTQAGLFLLNQYSQYTAPTISPSELQSYFGNFNNYCAFIDACYSGVFADQMTTGVIGTAASATETAWGGTWESYTVFGGALGDGLSPYQNPIPAGTLTAEGLFNYAKPIAMSRYGGATPQLKDNYPGGLGITAAIPPKISYFSQDPNPIYNGGTGYVNAYLSQGAGEITYSWTETHYPYMTVSLTPLGSSCQVHYYVPYNTSYGVFITCTASNAFGSDTKTYQLSCQYSSFASLAFETNGVLKDENPILVSSVNNPGVDVTDCYMINKEITPENQTEDKTGNVIKFSIHETDQAKGHTDLDQVELWEVKANKNEFVAVTEEGEVISYRKLEMPNQIILNDSLDITNVLADRDELKLAVKKGDRIKFSRSGNSSGNNDELYSVIYAQLYNAEDLSAVNNNLNDLYYFRPQPSTVCKKIKVIPSGDIEIKFTEDLLIDYFALVKNEKTAKAEKLNLLSAEHSKAGEIASLFAAADKQYGEILPGEEIKFKYEAKPNSNNDNTAYILKAVGKYEKAGLLKEGNHETISGLPKETTLYDNYPNPFNPTAKISFSLPQKSEIKLKVFDVLGREIQILAEGIYEAGKYEVEFNASNLPSGVYFYNLTSGTNSITKKMLLMK